MIVVASELSVHMKRAEAEGQLLDVSVFPKVGPFFVLPWDEKVSEWEKAARGAGVLFADVPAEEWIWSIGRALETCHHEANGVSYLIQKGQCLASRTTVFYEHNDFDCLWLK